MKKTLLVIITTLAMSITAIVGSIVQNEALMIFGVIVFGLFGLACLFWIFKKMCKFIGNSLTSVIFTLVVAGIIGYLAFIGKLNSFSGFIGGLLLGVLLLSLAIRKIAKYAQKSIMFGEVFSFITGYQIKNYLAHDSIVNKEELVEETQDYNNLVVILRDNMRYTKKEANAAARYAMNHTQPYQSTEDKIKAALKYMDSKQHVVNVSNN